MASELAVASRELRRGAYSLIANTALTSALGMGFWVLAARLYPRVTVGRDAVLISVMVELSTVCQLNLANGIVRFLPDLGAGSARALRTVYLVTGAAAIGVGGAFVLAAGGVSRELGFLARDPALAAGFVAALAIWGLFTLQDAALTATRQAPWVPVENAAFGALKLLALPALLLAGSAHGVFLAWVLPVAVLLIPVNALLFSRWIPRRVAAHGDRQASLARLGRRRAARFLAADYLASVFTQATLTALPLLVLAVLGARRSAYFAMPFTIAVAFDTFAYGACTALVVEATLARAELRALALAFARRVLAPLVPLAGALALAAPLVLLPFGSDYARQGATALRLLMGASVLRIALALFAAVSRVQGRGLRIALVELGLLASVLAPAIALARSGGIDAVAGAWLAGNALACAWVTPRLVRALKAG